MNFGTDVLCDETMNSNDFHNLPPLPLAQPAGQSFQLSCEIYQHCFQIRVLDFSFGTTMRVIFVVEIEMSENFWIDFD